MAVLPIGIGSAVAGGFNVERSLRFNSADSAYLSRTPSSSPTSNQKFTLSCWFKKSGFGGTYPTIYCANDAQVGGGYANISFPSETIYLQLDVGGTTKYWQTTQVFRDPSAWYHIVWAVDTTQATATDRMKLYINGSLVTTYSTQEVVTQNGTTSINIATEQRIGSFVDYGRYINGYLTEFYMIDGQQLAASSFGETDSATGVWKPKAFSGTYGTNGFYLKFADNSGTTSTTLGKDYSGNGNNWTPNNFSVTAGAGNDSLVDSPTSYGTDTGVGGEVRGNYCTLNPLDVPASYSSFGTELNGNLDFSVSNDSSVGSTFFVSSGKWYWEMTVVSGHSAGNNTIWSAITSLQPSSSNKLAWQAGSGSRSYATTGLKYSENTSASYGNTYTNGDVIGCALDLDNGKVYWSKNGTFQASGDPVAGTNAAYTGLTGSWMPEATQNAGVTSWNFGQRPFAYTAPSGFKALCTQNLPTPTIGATSTTQADNYFDIVLRNGFGTSGGSITSVQFQPDFIWEKRRTAANHQLVDSVRGVTKYLSSNLTDAEVTYTTYFTSFNSNGYTLGAGDYGTGDALVDWIWRAGGTGVTNTAGTITSTVSASTTSGFSIVTYTGTGANATVGHGLGVAPSLIITKERNTAVGNWNSYHASLGRSAYISLNTTNASNTSSNYWGTADPTSTVFGLGTAGNNTNTTTYVAYCFAPVAGYSAFGSYTGNGSADGVFVYTGFRPRFILFKQSSASGNDWYIYDAVRSTYNVATHRLFPNSSAAEATNFNTLDILSNGWKVRDSNSAWNASGATYIYAAFAESPFKYSLAR